MRMKSDNLCNTYPHYITAWQLGITIKVSYKQDFFISHSIHVKPESNILS